LVEVLMTDNIAQFPTARSGSGRRWGKAGVPLSADDVEAARRARVVETNKAKLRAENERATRPVAPTASRDRDVAPNIEGAHAGWAAGHIYPHRITQALNSRKLDGPEVDRACGVEEPAVDEWEMGIRYPTWQQLLALAKLTDYPVGFFTRPVRHIIEPADTSMPFHFDRHREAEPCLRSRPAVFGGYLFDPEAIRCTLGDGWR
jgi:transcriptional regulator with XRE-family HTH domain